VALAVDLAGQHPDRPEYLLVLAESRIKLAVLLRDTRVSHHTAQLPEAEQAIYQAGCELEALRATIPGDAESRQRLAESYDALCGQLTLEHKFPAAEAAVQAASGIWQALVKDHPAEFEYRLGLAKNHSRWGMQLMHLGGRNEAAEAALRQAVTLGSDLQAENPGDPRLRCSLHHALASLGVILSRTKREGEAEDVMRRALALSEGMAADFPDLTGHQEDLARDLHNLASTAANLGRLDEAVQLRKRVLAVREQLVARHPDISQYQIAVIDALWGLAENLSRCGKVEDARQLLQQGVLRARSYREAHPKESGVLFNALNYLFHVEIQISDHDAADRALDEMAALYRSELAHGFDESSDMVTNLLRSVDEVAQDMSTSPQYREARVRGGYLLFKAITRELGHQSSFHHKDLHILADVLSTAPEEFREPQLALKFAQRASELKPDDPMARQSLAWARYRVGDWKGCVEWLEKRGTNPKTGDFIAAMAYWKLGDRAEARAVFDLADAWLKGYEDRWKKEYGQGVRHHPEPWMLRPVRSEAAALLGVVPPEAGTDPK
jgi:tetratricopeptide (TPR) repeat protein